MYNTKKSDRYNPFKQDISLFTSIVTKVVGTCPFNIDGNKIYQMKCDESTWKEVWHQGKHICLLKKPPLEKDDTMKMVTMLKNVVQLHPYALN